MKLSILYKTQKKGKRYTKTKKNEKKYIENSEVVENSEFSLGGRLVNFPPFFLFFRWESFLFLRWFCLIFFKFRNLLRITLPVLTAYLNLESIYSYQSNKLMFDQL